MTADLPGARPDRHVVQCNYVEATGIAAAGARAYLACPNPGNGNDRIEILVRSRSGRWVRKWEDIRRLGDFRVKTLPPEHPLYADADRYGRIWRIDQADAQRRAETLTAARERATS